MENSISRSIKDFKKEGIQEIISFDELLLEPSLNRTLLRIGGRDYFVEILNILSLNKDLNELSEDDINKHLERMAAWQYTLVSAISELKYQLKVEKFNFEKWRNKQSESLRSSIGESKPSKERINGLLQNRRGEGDEYEIKIKNLYHLEVITEKTSNIYEILKLRNETLRSVLRSRDFKKGKGSGNAI